MVVLSQKFLGVEHLAIAEGVLVEGSIALGEVVGVDLVFFDEILTQDLDGQVALAHQTII